MKWNTQISEEENVLQILAKNKTMKEKNNKQIKKGFKYEDDQLEYTLKIKKRCKWCWLFLLLLLPLLLLIPLKKTIYVKTIDTKFNKVVPSVNVYFQYDKQSLRKSGKPYFKYNRTTDLNGTVEFYKIRYRLYSVLFKRKTRVLTSASSECYNSDTLNPYFHKIKDKDTLLLKLHPVLLDVEFTVVDADDNNEPLPQVLVKIKSELYGIIDSALSDSAGIVHFSKPIPKCSHIEVVASKYGWYDTTKNGIAYEINKDTLFLKQEKVIIKFYVRDLITNQPIANAHGQLFFRAAPTTQVGNDAITNMNGLGKGVFEDVHKIKRMRIDVNKNCYRDSSTVNYYIAENWLLKTRQEQTIYIAQKYKNVTLYTYKCWNPKRDSYKLFIDGNFVKSYRATTADEVTGEETRKNRTYETMRISLPCGSHTIRLELLKEGGDGSCSGCTEIAIPEINFSKYASRSNNDSTKSFSWTFNIN